MNLISAQFFLMVFLAVLLYYLIPLRMRWYVLLGFSAYFIVQVNSLKLLAVMLIMVGFSYTIGCVIDKVRENQKVSKVLLGLGICVNAGVLIFLKDLNFFINIGKRVQQVFGEEVTIQNVVFLAPLGISYYSLTLIGYLLDVYWGTVKAERNVIKFSLFASYFPILTSGPIIKLTDVNNQIYRGHKFDYDKFCFGLQRIGWGLFKKIVISERLALYINCIYADYVQYSGIYIWLAFLLFPIQLYTDFSGCIDICLGVSELFGISLPENFNLPFMAETVSEFWRRWHITLGGWMRDYVLYPILKTDLWQRLGRITRKKFGKKMGKKVPVWMGTLIIWFLVGFWHGGAWNYIFGVGLFCGIVIILGEMLSPLFRKFINLLKIDTECFSWKFFRMLRTSFIFVIATSFFRSQDGFLEAFQIWKYALSTFNPWVLFDGSLNNIGLDSKEWTVVMISILVLIFSGVFRGYLQRPIRDWIAEQNLFFRWGMYLILIFGVVILGKYGSGYNAAAFIYQQF